VIPNANIGSNRSDIRRKDALPQDNKEAFYGGRLWIAGCSLEQSCRVCTSDINRLDGRVVRGDTFGHKPIRWKRSPRGHKDLDDTKRSRITERML
jgi:hypothetical protein